jgi:hypothetical protein
MEMINYLTLSKKNKIKKWIKINIIYKNKDD